MSGLTIFSATRSLAVLASLLVLAACGGGGGDSTPAPAAATFTIGGTISGLATGANVVLQNNGGNNLTVSTNGSFTFTTAVTSGSAYAVTVLTQPSGPTQTCTVSSGSGTATANVTNVTVTCVTSSFAVSGTVSGLSGSIVLQNNAAGNLTVSANGSFSFPAQLSGSAYAVTVLSHPTGPAQTCTVTNGVGTVAAAAVSNVAIVCATSSFTVGGTVSGLATGGNVVLQNNGGNNLTVSNNGSFTFTTPLSSGATYVVTRLTNPTVPAGTPAGQTCTVSSGSGTVTSANVTNVTVACANNDQVAPTVSAKSPATTANGVLLTTTATATFNEALDPATVTVSTFTLTDSSGSVSGTVTTTAGGTKAVFTPTSPLKFNTEYTATLTTAIKDVAGNPLASSQTWKFNSGEKISIGGRHACARMNDGRVKCWGRNNLGQLGIDNAVNHGDGTGFMGDGTGASGSGLLAVNLGAGRTAVAISAGQFHSCAVLDNGQVKCWGSNANGELGLGFTSGSVGATSGDMANNVLPVNLGAGRTALEISASDSMTCARLDNGTVKCWGLNTNGGLGQGNTTNLGVAANDIANAPPINLGTGRTAIHIATGAGWACAILDNNATKCWGDNFYGELGLGDTNNRGDQAGEMGDTLAAVDLGPGNFAVEIRTSEAHTCARLQNNAVRCWGNNGWGQVGNNLGNGSPSDRADCSTGGSTTCIGDQVGEMGVALTNPIGVASAVSIGVGDRNTCALLQGGTVKCWGSNEFGQIGIEDNASPHTNIGDDAGEIAALASAILRPGTTVAELSVGGFFNCVYNTDNTIQCWGENTYGQIGLDNPGIPQVGDGPGSMGANLTDLNLGT